MRFRASIPEGSGRGHYRASIANGMFGCSYGYRFEDIEKRWLIDSMSTRQMMATVIVDYVDAQNFR